MYPLLLLLLILFCVTFSGLSKSHMIAGFRIGWMILSGNKAVAKDYIEGLNMLSNMRLCSNVLRRRLSRRRLVVIRVLMIILFLVDVFMSRGNMFIRHFVIFLVFLL